MRPSGRQPQEMRSITFETNVNKHAEGSCLVKVGDTHVLCTASVENKVPGWMRGTGEGWVTAEYGMLPRSTGSRNRREATAGKQSGRTQEIQRLIGRALRAVVDMGKLGERQVKIDCDVLQADGGTRTAAINGGFVAMQLAVEGLIAKGELQESPISGKVCAISTGIYKGTPVLDLDYDEDSNAEADANIVMTPDGGIIEVQATAEEDPFEEAQFFELVLLAKKGIMEIGVKQEAAVADGVDVVKARAAAQKDA